MPHICLHSIMGSQTLPKIPVINFSDDNMNPGTPHWRRTCHDVRRALEDYGCLIADLKTFPLELHNRIFEASQQLFDVPYETKLKNVSEKPSHGYVGKNLNLPLHEGLGVDGPTIKEECNKFTKLMWPDGNNYFCETTYSYAEKVQELEQTVTRMIFESYGVGNRYEAHEASMNYLLRFLSYKKPTSDEGVAFLSHTDKSFVSIIHQNHVLGLEMITEDGKFIPFEPSPTSFVFIVGDACMAWSNGRMKSVYHQVAMRAGGKDEKRYSLALFSFVKEVVETTKEFVDEEHPLLYKDFDHYGLLHFYTKDPKNRIGRIIMKEYCGV